MFARVKSSQGRNFLVEILMIIVGINVALWFEGWFDHLNDRETERQYLVGLRDDLNQDIVLLDDVIETNTRRQKRLEEIIPELRDFADQPAEAQAKMIFVPSSYWFFQPADFTYRSMQESGDFHLLEDDSIKKDILRLIRVYRDIDTLQINFLQALDSEYIPVMMSKFDIIDSRITDPTLATDQVFLNFFPYTYQDTEQRNVVYADAREQAKKLVTAITALLGDDPES